MRTRQSDDTVIELDELDLRIIELLQQDGRQPYGRVGEAVGLSEPAVRQRTLRLVAARVTPVVGGGRAGDPDRGGHRREPPGLPGTGDARDPLPGRRRTAAGRARPA